MSTSAAVTPAAPRTPTTAPAYDTDDARRPRVSLSLCAADVNVLRAWRERSKTLRALWDDGDNVTMWAGVVFGNKSHGRDNDGRVLEIDLNRRGLTGDLPPGLEGLTALKRLFLDGNQLTSLPAALGELTELISLHLDGNHLTSFPEELGRGLPALRGLSICGNCQLTSLPAEWEEGGIGRLKGLTIRRHLFHSWEFLLRSKSLPARGGTSSPRAGAGAVK